MAPPSILKLFSTMEKISKRPLFILNALSNVAGNEANAKLKKQNVKLQIKIQI
jgi:hypothetical protein